MEAENVPIVVLLVGLVSAAQALFCGWMVWGRRADLAGGDD